MLVTGSVMFPIFRTVFEDDTVLSPDAVVFAGKERKKKRKKEERKEKGKLEKSMPEFLLNSVSTPNGESRAAIFCWESFPHIH